MYADRDHDLGHAPAPAAGSMRVFDGTHMLEMLGGDTKLALAIAESAMQDIPGYLEKLESAVRLERWMEAERATHALKSLVAQVGGGYLSERFKELDIHLKNGGQTDMATVAGLQGDYRVLVRDLKTWLGVNGDEG